MRLNGVKAILEYIGQSSRRSWKHLTKQHGLPYYRDKHNPRRVWAKSEELDKWDEAQSVKNGR